MSNTESVTQLPRKQRVVITILFFAITLFLSLIALNKLTTEALVSFGRAEIQATVVQKNTTRGKSGTSYFYKYRFEVANKQYVRPLFFGLLSGDTKITKSDYDSIEEGSIVSVFYCKLVPQFNIPQHDPYKYDKFIFIIGGIILFGIMLVNETKALIQNKKQQE